MHVAILSVRDKTYHPNSRLMAAAVEMGHRISLIHTRDGLSCIQGGRQAVRLPEPDFPETDLPDILLPRVGATINDYALSVVRHFALSGTRVVNGFESILMARNKFMGLQRLAKHGISVPDSYLVVTLEGFERAVEQLGGYPVVAKMPGSRQGDGVMRVENQATASFVMNNLMDNARGILVQEYIPPEGRTDIRAFVLGDRVLGAMALEPGPADFRTNIHLTGQGRMITLSPDLSKLAVRSSRALGLEISGTDIIIDKNGFPNVIEVNYSPGFRGLEEATGINIAERIIHYVTKPQG
ncbi:MAG: RimK family alpha-L-glutamate ligase [Deltaproteobacteria bacterium]|nr:RimK family alpha-L-glutamate ligase [Deltaproteobacteria bacterium]